MIPDKSVNLDHSVEIILKVASGLKYQEKGYIAISSSPSPS